MYPESTTLALQEPPENYIVKTYGFKPCGATKAERFLESLIDKKEYFVGSREKIKDIEVKLHEINKDNELNFKWKSNPKNLHLSNEYFVGYIEFSEELSTAKVQALRAAGIIAVHTIPKATNELFPTLKELDDGWRKRN